MQIFRLEIEVSTFNNHHCCSLLQVSNPTQMSCCERIFRNVGVSKVKRLFAQLLIVIRLSLRTLLDVIEIVSHKLRMGFFSTNYFEMFNFTIQYG